MNGGVAGTVTPKSISFRSLPSVVAEEVPRADVAMDEAGGVDGGDGLGRLADQSQAVAFQAAVAADEQGIQVGPFEVLHHQVRRALGGRAVFVGLDDPRMLQAEGDFAFGGLVAAP